MMMPNVQVIEEPDLGWQKYLRYQWCEGLPIGRTTVVGVCDEYV